MFGLSRKKTGPIGIDFGQTTLRMVQVEFDGNKVKLSAAGCRKVPDEIRNQPAQLDSWYAESIRTLLNEVPFKGKKCITSVPGKDLLVQHIRMPRQDQVHIGDKLGQELEGKLPFSTQGALLRHIVAGEIYTDSSSEPKVDVIVMAASAAAVHRYLRIIQTGHLMIETVSTESVALMKAFSQMMTGQFDNSAYMLVDLGYSNTRVIIASGAGMQFGRCIPLSYGTLQRAMMKDRGLTARQADGLIGDFGNARETDAAGRDGAVAVAASVCSMAIGQHIQMLDMELQNCIRYHDMAFQACPVERIIFLGGLVNNIAFCQTLARSLCLPAQIGDPMAVAVNNTAHLPDCLAGQTVFSDWAVAYGLALQN